MLCQARTKKGEDCKYKAKTGNFCGKHTTKEIEKKETVTITFCEVAENHVGMQKIGKMKPDGFTIEDLTEMNKRIKNSELIRLDTYGPAAILVIRNAIDNDKELFEEMKALEWDKKAFMKGRVVNKNARWNLCFADEDQEPDYEKGKGRVISFNDTKILRKIRDDLPERFGEKAADLVAEGNYYYSSSCGIGFHGDSERKRVIGLRLGDSIPLEYQWFERSKPIGERIRIELNSGDMYVMSEKAVGSDWHTKKIPTLRHAAGNSKYLTIEK